MKLLNFRAHSKESVRFGALLDGGVVSFQAMQQAFKLDWGLLKDIETYLENFPESERKAKELLAMARDRASDLPADEVFPLNQVKVLPPVPRPPALLDFALSPEHLRNSALTLFKYEKKWPLRALMSAFVKADYKKNKNKANFRCYKGNHNAIIGDMDSPVWPRFSSYLDIEAELGVVVGKTHLHMSEDELSDSIAGYTIFNDFSARDVQLPEMFGMLGPAKSKDFDGSNGIGPFLVTPDEIPDPLSLNVTVKVGDRHRWEGNTSGYVARPIQVIEYLTGFQTLLPGTIIGMGTVPGCCGLERDEWILPGELIEISFEGLGTLRQPIPAKIGPIDEPRWKKRPELDEFLCRAAD